MWAHPSRPAAAGGPETPFGDPRGAHGFRVGDVRGWVIVTRTKKSRSLPRIWRDDQGAGWLGLARRSIKPYTGQNPIPAPGIIYHHFSTD